MANYSGSWDTLFWSPREISALASDLAEWGKTVEDSVKAAYTTIDNLGRSQDWIGKLFNDLANFMNDQKGFFEHSLNVLAIEIPSALDSSARIDAEASQAAYTPYTPTVLVADYEIALTADDNTGELAFNSINVQTASQDFVNCFNTARENLDSYKSNFDSLFRSIFGVKTQAYEKYIYTVDSTYNACLENFQAFVDMFNTKAAEAEAAINAADTSSAQQVNNISSVGSI